MSGTYDERLKKVEENSKKLSPLPKELKWFSTFNFLKSSVIKKIEDEWGNIPKEDKENLSTFTENDHFGYNERLVNVLMHYAYLEGAKDAGNTERNKAKSIRLAFDKIVDALDEIDYLPEMLED